VSGVDKEDLRRFRRYKERGRRRGLFLPSSPNRKVGIVLLIVELVFTIHKIESEDTFQGDYNVNFISSE
jgi:hypothetical protein